MNFSTTDYNHYDYHQLYAIARFGRTVGNPFLSVSSISDEIQQEDIVYISDPAIRLSRWGHLCGIRLRVICVWDDGHNIDIYDGVYYSTIPKQWVTKV